MKIVWDFDNLFAFGNRLSDFHNYETAIMTATQEVAKVLHQALITRTPVLTGNLRKCWSNGDNLQFIVEKTNGGYTVTLENDAQNEHGYKYGYVVNYGHRSPNGGWVVGRFFIENSIIETEEKLNKVVQKELQKWLEWCVNGK